MANTPSAIANYLREYFLTKIGNNTLKGHLFAAEPDTYDLGSSTNPFRAVYATSLVGVSGSTDEKVAAISGATPGYLDTVLAVNTSYLSKSVASGVMTLSMLKAPLWADGTIALTGNLAVNSGVTIDGVDVSVLKSDYDAHIITYNAHVINADAHHAKQHSITDAANHTVTGSQYSVVGLTATNTLGILASTADGSANLNTLLRSNGSGNLKLTSLTTATIDSTSSLTFAPATNIIVTPAATNGVMEISDNKGIKMGSASFVSGFAGAGSRWDYGITNSGKYTLTVEDLVVRGSMYVYELLIQQIRATNGSLFVTDSAKIISVTGTGPYTMTVDGKTNDYQPFAVNDKIRAQKVYLGSGIQIKKCDMTVTAINVGANPKVFTATLVGGTDAPESGMDFVRLGNSSDTARQGGIYLTSSDSGAPFIDIVDGIAAHSDWNTSAKNKVRLGKLSGITDTTLNPSGYGLYSSNAFLKGTISAANDVVRIDSNGIRIKSSVGATDSYGAYKFANASNTEIGGMYGAEITQFGASYTNTIEIRAIPSTYGSSLGITTISGAGADQRADTTIGAYGQSGAPASKSVSMSFRSPAGSGGTAYIEIGNPFDTNYVLSNIEYRSNATVRPNSDLIANLGTAAYRWGVLYVDQIIASTISGASMSGATWQYNGSMVINPTSAVASTVSIANSGAGSASLDVEGNITLGGTVDGVDVSLLNSNFTSLSGDFSTHTSNVDAHHARDHVFATTSGLGATHTVSGLTAGQVLKATSATTALFVQLAHSELSGLTTGDPHCFSNDTELLTRRGFVNYIDISEDDEALTMNLSSGKMEYQKIISKHVYDNFTELISIKNKKMDILVTPKHEMVYTHDAHNYHKKMAQDILDYKTILIPVSGFADTQRVNLSDDFLTLLGLIISEGHFCDPKRYGYGVKLYQRLSSSEFIETILNKCEIPYTKYVRTTTKANESMVEFYISSNYARHNIRNWLSEKRIPESLMNLGGDQFWAFLKGLVYGDGSVRSVTGLDRTTLIENIDVHMMNHSASYCYASADKILTDQITQLCAINGIRAYQYFSKGGFKDGAWRINLTYTRNVRVSPLQQHKRVAYSGDVWCVVVPNHTLVVRRNGAAFIAGNTQYVANATARTITAIHTFNPTVAGAWITLGANATGQLITGLNADLLDGYDSAAFPRKAENATISGAWTFNADLTLGTGVQIQSATESADKWYLTSNTSGIGIEADAFTKWASNGFRFRIGGTSATTGTQSVFINSSGIKIGTGSATQALDVTGNGLFSGTVTASDNVDSTHTFGKTKIGFLTAVAGEMAIAQYAHAGASSYMIKQTSTGNVMVNAPTGTAVDIRINNASKFKVDTVAQTTVNLGVNKSPTVALDVLGATLISSTLTASDNVDSVHILGKGKFGFITGVASEFAIGHYDHAGASGYFIKQTSGGNVMVNAPTSSYVDIRNNNSTKLKVDTTNAQFSVNVGIGKTPTLALDVVGDFLLTGNITSASDTDVVTTLGRGKLGYYGVADEFAIAHFDRLTSTDYLAKQTNAGDSYINAVTGRTLYFAVNGGAIANVTSSGLGLSSSKWIQSQTFSSSFPISGFKINEISGNKYSLTIGNVSADTLTVKTFVADEVRIDRGDEYWGKGYGIVETTFTTPALIGDNGVEAWFENAPSIAGGIFSDADWIHIRMVDISTGISITDIWGQVYSASAGGVGGYLLESTPTNSVNRQRWRFVLRNGPTNTVVTRGITAINYGSTGQAFIRLSTVDTAGAPYISFGRWSGSDPYTPANRAEEIVIGKLTTVSGPIGTVGIYSKYGTSTFELSDAGALLKNIPIQSFNGANQTYNLSSSGTDFWIGVSSGDKRLTWNGTTLAITGTITATAGTIGGWTIASGLLSATNIGLDSTNSKIYIGASSTYGTDGIQLERNAGNPRAYIGNGTTQYFKFDGTSITWSAANTSLDASGNLTATNATLSGAITATSGAIGGWTVASGSLSSTNIGLDSTNSKIYIGASATFGTDGIQLERNVGNPRAYIGNGTDNYFKFDGSVITWGALNTTLDASGILTAVDAILSGTVEATAGSIGGWTIATNDLLATNIALRGGALGVARITVGTETTSATAGIASSSVSGDIAFWAGATHPNRATAPFRVSLGGALTATSATITGAITASSGSLTGFLTLGASGGIYQGTGSAGTPTTGLKIWNDSGVGRIAGYNAGTIQWWGDTSGKLQAGGTIIDSTGITFNAVDGASYVRHGSGASEISRYYSNTDLSGLGSGYYEIKTRSLNDTFDGVTDMKFTIANSAWTTQVQLGLYRDIYDSYVYSTKKLVVGLGSNPTSNVSGFVTQTASNKGSISLTNTNWGNGAAIGFNAYQADNSISPVASGAFKFLGLQYTGNITRPGMQFWDGNSGTFAWYYGEAALSSGANITTWTKSFEIGTSFVKAWNPVTIQASAGQYELLRLHGGGTGAANSAYMSFYDQAGTTQYGYIGDASTGNSDITLRAIQAGLVLGDSSNAAAITISGGNTKIAGNIGFYNVNPVARPTAYTQTYATTTRTHANVTATAPSAYAAGSNGYSTGAKASEVHAAVIALINDVINVKQIVNSIIDDLQANGMFQ